MSLNYCSSLDSIRTRRMVASSRTEASSSLSLHLPPTHRTAAAILVYPFCPAHLYGPCPSHNHLQLLHPASAANPMTHPLPCLPRDSPRAICCVQQLGFGPSCPSALLSPPPPVMFPAPCTSTALPCCRLQTNPELTTLLEHMSAQHGIQFIYEADCLPSIPGAPGQGPV